MLGLSGGNALSLVSEEWARYRALRDTPAADPSAVLSAAAGLVEALDVEGMERDATGVLESLVVDWRVAFGHDDLQTVAAEAALALRLVDWTNPARTEALEQHVLEVRQRRLGPADPLTLEAALECAGTMIGTGRLEEGEVAARTVMGAFRSTLGLTVPGTLAAARLLARCLCRQQRGAEGVAIVEDLVDERRDRCGLDALETLEAEATLAEILEDMGDLDRTEALQRHILEARAEALGPGDAATRDAGLALGETLKALGRHEEREVLLLDLVERERRIEGTGGARTLVVTRMLGRTLERLGRDEEALALLEALVEERRSTYGAEAFCTVEAEDALARLCYRQGDHERSLMIERRVLADRRHRLGPDHGKTYDAVWNLCCSLDRLALDEELAETVPPLLEVERGRDPAGFEARELTRMLAWAYQRQGRGEEGGALLAELVEVLAESGSMTTPEAAGVMWQHAALLISDGEGAEAEPVLRDVLAFWLRSADHDDSWIRAATAALADLLGSLDRHADAIVILDDVHDVMAEAFGPDHLATVGIEACYGPHLRELGESARRLDHAFHVYRVRLRELDLDAPDLARAFIELFESLQAVGEPMEAALSIRDLLAECEELEGPQGPFSIRLATMLLRVHQRHGSFVEAEALARRYVDICAESEEPDRLQGAVFELRWAQCLQALGERDRAEVACRRALRGYLTTVGALDEQALGVARFLTDILLELDRRGEAFESLEAIVEARRALVGSDAEETVLAERLLGTMLWRAGEAERSAAVFQRVFDQRVAQEGGLGPRSLRAGSELATALRGTEHPDASVALLRQLLEAQRSAWGAEHPLALSAEEALALSLEACGALDESAVHLAWVHDARMRQLGPDHDDTRRVAERLVVARARIAERVGGAGCGPQGRR